jgi:hypothetical protein
MTPLLVALPGKCCRKNLMKRVHRRNFDPAMFRELYSVPRLSISWMVLGCVLAKIAENAFT